MSEPGPRLCVSVGVFRAGAVLLIERARPPAKGFFTLPGGGVRPGETLAAAASRELREETGLSGEVLGLIDVIEWVERATDGSLATHSVILSYALHWRAGEVVPSDEVGAFLWADPLALPERPYTPGLREVLARGARMASAR
jgi:ADP-ribose pyrophosphatase YjhB (NUDIX family)